MGKRWPFCLTSLEEPFLLALLRSMLCATFRFSHQPFDLQDAFFQYYPDRYYVEKLLHCLTLVISPSHPVPLTEAGGKPAATFCSVSNQLQVAQQCLLAQFPDHFMDNDPIRINKDGLWNAGETVINARRAGRIYNILVRNAVGMQKAQSTALRICKVDTKKDDALTLYSFPRRLQQRRFLFAWITP